MMTTWLQHVQRWQSCQRCALAQQRGLICLARGTVPCDVLFVGEAPGISEDAEGKPFWGPAGMHLDDIIAAALPPDVPLAFTNLVACFPREAKTRGDNEPERGEILECRPRLIEFVNVAQPRLIVLVGRLSVQHMGFDRSVPMVDIDHPAHILRMPLAQRGFASQRAAVTIRNAYDDLPPRRPWRQWGKQDAEDTRTQLRRIYRDAEGNTDEIPF